MKQAYVWAVVVTVCWSVMLASHDVALCAEAERPELAPLLYLPFDGSATPAVPTQGISVTKEEDLTFAEGQVGKAADFRDKGCVEYRNLPAFNTHSGTIELWVRPAHDHKELQDHYYVQFFGQDDKPVLEVQFCQARCATQAIMRAGDRVSGAYCCGGINTDRWIHIIATWDDTNADLSGIGFYRNGGKNRFPASYHTIEAPRRLRVGCRSPDGASSASALIDEVCVYNRSLTPAQAKALYENAKLPMAEKLRVMRERVAGDDALAREQTDALFNRRKIGIIHGRYTSLANWPDKVFERLGLPVPTKIHETELVSTDMSQYDAVIVPGGGGLKLDDANRDALQEYLRQGGGYVGVCGGATTAGKYGLVAAKQYSFDVRGRVFSMLNSHPITEGYENGSKLLIAHASGPLFVLEEGSDEIPVAVFVVGGNSLFGIGGGDLPMFVNIIAKPYGKGRVAVFSCHPESSQQSYRLLRNAVMWTAKITAREDAPEPQP